MTYATPATPPPPPLPFLAVTLSHAAIRWAVGGEFGGLTRVSFMRRAGRHSKQGGCGGVSIFF